MWRVAHGRAAVERRLTEGRSCESLQRWRKGECTGSYVAHWTAPLSASSELIFAFLFRTFPGNLTACAHKCASFGN